MASSLADAARRLTQHDVAPAELAEIAAAHPDLRPAVAAHPNAYAELRAWIAQAAPPVAPPVQASIAPSAPPPVVENQGPVTRDVAAPRRAATLPWVVAAVAVVVALGSVGVLLLGGPSGESPSQERGFASPEDAVGYVVERLAADDAAGASEAFAVETLVDGYSYQAVVERAGAALPWTWLPVSSDGYRAIDEGLRRGEVADQLRALVRGVLAPDRDFTATTVLGDDLTAADLERELAPEPLADLSVLRVDELHPADDRYRENAQVRAEIYGADEFREVGVLYGTANGPVIGGATLLRYGDDWHVSNLSSDLLGTGMGGVEPTSVQHYEDAIARIQD